MMENDSRAGRFHVCIFIAVSLRITSDNHALGRPELHKNTTRQVFRLRGIRNGRCQVHRVSATRALRGLTAREEKTSCALSCTQLSQKLLLSINGNAQSTDKPGVVSITR